MSEDDSKVAMAKHLNQSGLISNTWSEGLAKSAVLRAIASVRDRFASSNTFDADMTHALAQKPVCFLHSYSSEVEEVHY